MKTQRLKVPRLFDHPGRPGGEQAPAKVTTDPAEVRRFFAQHFNS